MAGRLSFHCCRNISSLNWVKAALLFFIYHLAGAVSDRVIVDPHITAVLGKNITLICKVFVVEALTQISWEKVQNGSTQTLAVYNPSYGISIDEPYQQRMSFKSPSNRDATIILEDVRFTDTGEYICKVTTFPSGNSQSSTTVSVMVEPKVYVVKGSQPLTDGGNETIVAVCKAEKGKPAAEVTWESDVFGQSFQNLSTEPNETITVSNYYKWIPTRFAQGKQLTCVVRHPALEMEVRIPFVLNIKHAPEVGITGYDENWFVGRENVQLKCNVAANPPPTKYVWSRSDGEWPSDLQSVNNTLIFSKPLHHNHSGTYQCEVTNEIGSSKKQRTIHILDVPSKQTSSVAVAGAVMGAVLALLLIAIFIIVLLTPRKRKPSYLDKVIDLPPMHKPPPPYAERTVLALQPVHTTQVKPDERHHIFEERIAGASENRRATHCEQLTCHEWICQNKGLEKIYINHREHYV
ncbi:nectin-3-like protein isoform X2 [Polypterus senegalus]|uniref:nectin-3-like protein isoform X2 n=1 Tax=Polypterus senegalus TaxID=55291 RepID=UPI001966AC0A|nr:nectin-3-like protein isoform X2 [Polypterus senegalus]